MSELYNLTELLKYRGIIIKLFEGTATASGNAHSAAGHPVNAMPFKEATFFLNVTAASGTSPTLDVVVESKDPSGDVWDDLAVFTQATAVSHQKENVAANLGDRVSLKYTLGGTDPSFTFTVYAIAKIV